MLSSRVMPTIVLDLNQCKKGTTTNSLINKSSNTYQSQLGFQCYTLKDSYVYFDRSDDHSMTRIPIVKIKITKTFCRVFV